MKFGRFIGSWKQRILFIFLIFLGATASADNCGEMLSSIYGIRVTKNWLLPFVAAAVYPKSEIHINPVDFFLLPLHLQEIIVLHEWAHIRLNHGFVNPNNSYELWQAEYQADLVAMDLWLKKWKGYEQFVDVLNYISVFPGAFTHPPGYMRAQHLAHIFYSN